MVKEKFSNYLSGFLDNSSNSNTSRSFLNSPNNNLYNSIYCPALVSNSNGFIRKKDFNFTDDTVPIDSYYKNGFDGNASSENVCMNECRKNKYCGSYKFDSGKSTGNCSLYNNLPNSYSSQYGTSIGYKVNKAYDFNKLNNNQKNNIWKKCGSQWLAKKYKISGNNIDKCITPQLSGNKLNGYDTNAECLWDTLSSQNDNLKKTVYKKNYIEDASLSKSVPNPDIDDSIKNFYSKVNNNVVFSNLNNKEIIDNRDNDVTFESSLINNVNSYYDINSVPEGVSNNSELNKQIKERVGLQESFQNNIDSNNNNYKYILYFIIIIVLIFLLFNLF